MNTKYVSIADAPSLYMDWYTTNQGGTDCIVTETDNAPKKTGILDAHGVPIYRVTTREPIGFRIRSEAAK